MNSSPIQSFALGDKNSCIGYSIPGVTHIIFVKETKSDGMKANNKELPFGCLGMKFVNNIFYFFTEEKKLLS